MGIALQTKKTVILNWRKKVENIHLSQNAILIRGADLPSMYEVVQFLRQVEGTFGPEMRKADGI